MATKPEVLVVSPEASDTPSIVDGLRAESQQLNLSAANTIEQAIEAIDTDAYSCVVTAHSPPGLDGLKLIERIGARIQSPPVVMFAAPDNVDVRRAVDTGASFVSRDSSTTQYVRLVNRIESIINRNESHISHSADSIHSYLDIDRMQDPLTAAEALCEVTDFLAILDQTGKIAFADTTAHESLGYQQGELVGKNAIEYAHPEDRTQAREAIRRLVTESKNTEQMQVRMEADDGTWRWLDVRATQFDSASQTSIVATGHDISGQKVTERAIADLHAATRDFNRAESKSAVADRIVHTIEETLGHENNGVRFVSDDGTYLELVTTSDRAQIALGDRPRYPVGEGTAGRAFETGETLVVEDLSEFDDAYERQSIRSGLYIPLGDHGTVSIGAKRPDAFDDTDIRLAETVAENATVAMDRIDRLDVLQRQTERMDQFISIVSHDLRNPLTIANGKLSLERQENCSQHLDDVADALTQMDELISSLLTFAREGDSIEELEQVSIEDVAETCWVGTSADSATLHTDTDSTVLADRVRFKQLLENLLRNAVEHGGEDVRIWIGDFPGGFYVADDGPGIPQEHRESVFEAGVSNNNDGTGFGLSIVKQIVELHGWNISVAESNAGGARFNIHTDD